MSTKRPRKIEWEACPCGSPACKRQYPTNLGMFYQGSGFEPEEVEWLNEAWDTLNAAEDEEVMRQLRTTGEPF